MRLAVVVLILLWAAAQAGGQAVPRTYTVWRDERAQVLAFVEVVSGEEVRVPADGQRFTPVQGGVMWWDIDQRRVMWATPDGLSRPHPFVQPEAGDARLDWVASEDGARLLWTTLRDDGAGTVSTRTWVAQADGTGRRQVFEEARTDGLRVKPVGFSATGALALMDYQPVGLDDLILFPQFAGLFTLDLMSEGAPTPAFLPDEPSDFTGAGVRDGRVVRLTVGADGGFDLRVLDLALGRAQTIDALPLSGFTLAGDVSVSPDGARAVYTLATITGGAGAAVVRSVVVLVDVSGLTQTALTTPQDRLLRAAGWTEDGLAVLLTDPAQDGTWKVRIDDGQIEPVASVRWIGTIEE